jgi:bifunctional DNA-binding transcriptional regulator/antitoxin component of YhaV-PrlF toxin-antitoxin module
MIRITIMKVRLKISSRGQVCIPAIIRRRWGSTTVALSDEGHRIVLEPVADDPVAAAEVALASEFGKLDTRRLRHEARDNERLAEGRRRKR